MIGYVMGREVGYRLVLQYGNYGRLHCHAVIKKLPAFAT
jgi:hypothetical protein